MIKRVLALLTPALIVVLFFGSYSFAASDALTPDLTKEEFESDLLDRIKKATGNEKESLQIEYDKYTDLDADEQDSLIFYLNDETFMNELSEEYYTPNSTDLSITTSEEDVKDGVIVTHQVNDDIAIEEEKLDFPSQIKTDEMTIMSQTREAWYAKSVKVFGIKVMEHKSSLDYKRTAHGGRITSILGSDHRITRNFTINSINYTGKISDYANTWAYSRSNFSMSLIHKGVWTYQSGKCQVRVDNKSNVTGYFNNG